MREGPANNELPKPVAEIPEPSSQEAAAAGSPKSESPKVRKKTEPTAQQIAAAEAAVTDQPDVDTLTAAWWLRCSTQHVLRLVRERKQIGRAHV